MRSPLQEEADAPPVSQVERLLADLAIRTITVARKRDLSGLITPKNNGVLK